MKPKTKLVCPVLPLLFIIVLRDPASIIFAHNKTVITHRYNYVHRKSKQIYRLKIARDSQHAKINCRFMYPQQFEYEMFLKDGNWDSIKNIKYLGYI